MGQKQGHSKRAERLEVSTKNQLKKFGTFDKARIGGRGEEAYEKRARGVMFLHRVVFMVKLKQK
jgi:hypothetical protein